MWGGVGGYPADLFVVAMESGARLSCRRISANRTARSCSSNTNAKGPGSPVTFTRSGDPSERESMVLRERESILERKWGPQ